MPRVLVVDDDPVCQLADLRSPRPRDELAEARDWQRQLERCTGTLAAGHGQSAAVRHLGRLTGDMIRDLAGDEGAS